MDKSSQGMDEMGAPKGWADRIATMPTQWRQLFAPLPPGSEPAWDQRMTMLAVVALLLVGAATLIDEQASRFAAGTDIALYRWLSAITDIGLGRWYVWPALVIVLIVGALNLDAMSQRGRQISSRLFGNALYLAVIVPLPHVIVQPLKILVGRARPPLIDQGGPFNFDPFNGAEIFRSFPSGHATTCGAVAVALAIWFPALRVPMLLLGALAAWSRVAALAHYPSDVAAGYSLGALTALWLARHLAARGFVFQTLAGRLMPAA